MILQKRFQAWHYIALLPEGSVQDGGSGTGAQFATEIIGRAEDDGFGWFVEPFCKFAQISSFDGGLSRLLS